MECRQAIIEDNKIIGWKDYKRPRNKLTVGEWVKTEEGKRTKRATLETARNISKDTGERFHLKITKRKPFRWYVKWHLPIGSRLIGRSA